MTASATPATADADDDGIPNATDNCSLVPNNAPGTVPNSPSVPRAQLDSDGDGYGNICDADINNTRDGHHLRLHPAAQRAEPRL